MKNPTSTNVQGRAGEFLVAVIGATGTGKSSFIKLLTYDDNIHIGHTQQSETDDVRESKYFDENHGLTVTLLDTPGFDDPREGVTDTHVLHKIAKFLQEGPKKLNGVIYMHRISDPHIRGMSRKNLRMLKELCGDDTLSIVRIVTTNWDRVSKDRGLAREDDFAKGALKSLIGGQCKAVMRRHDDGLHSAQNILSDLISIGKPPVTLKIQTELNGSITVQNPTSTNIQGNTGEFLVAVMGATGTGKSSFIKLLTYDDNIHIGHTQQSETDDVRESKYFDENHGLTVTLIDTPGFDDSREGVTDTHVLDKIAKFLQEGPKKLNGVIYMHRISDTRVGGMSRKNLRMLKELCGDDTLSIVRIVTTNWDRVSKDEGPAREDDLAKSAFKSLIGGQFKAVMCRHDKGLDSAQNILSDLINIDTQVTLKIQEELNGGKSLAETSAGEVINEDIRRIQEEHRNELAALKIEMEAAMISKNEEFMSELEAERLEREEAVARGEADRERLEITFYQERERHDHAMKAERAEFNSKLAKERAANERKLQTRDAKYLQMIQAQEAKSDRSAELRNKEVRNQMEAQRAEFDTKLATERAENERRLQSRDAQHLQMIRAQEANRAESDRPELQVRDLNKKIEELEGRLRQTENPDADLENDYAKAAKDCRDTGAKVGAAVFTMLTPVVAVKRAFMG